MTNHTITILGTGIVGTTLAHGLKQAGYRVTLANRKGTKVEGWHDSVAPYQAATAGADVIILAVKGAAAEDVVTSLRNELSGKTVIDTTNPITDDPPDDGVLQYFTAQNESLMERLQMIAPEANFVKALNSVGNGVMVQPKFTSGPPTMFICGDNEAAKQRASELLTKLGWESYDMGGVEAARAIEPLCMLWCIPGFRDNSWNHAFKLLK